MRTIVITIELPNVEQQTVKSTIQEHIAFHLKEKEKAKEVHNTLVKQCENLLEQVRNELNTHVGEEVWFKGRDKFSIGFRDGIYKNTPYNDWDIRVNYNARKVKYGEIEYTVPNVENGIKLTLEPSEENRKAWKNVSHQKQFNITDLSEVHKYLEKDYLTYFTRKI